MQNLLKKRTFLEQNVVSNKDSEDKGFNCMPLTRRQILLFGTTVDALNKEARSGRTETYVGKFTVHNSEQKAMLER